nr:monodictyphenone cluster transcription factor [Quercus suber]
MFRTEQETVDMQNAASPPRTSSSSSHNKASSTTQRSLRSSCDICAASKIGCTKEKPACSRCLKRGLPCNYSLNKRPGRPLSEPQPPSAATASPVATKRTQHVTANYPPTPQPSSSSSIDSECDASRLGACTIPLASFSADQVKASHGKDDGGNTLPAIEALSSSSSVIPAVTPSFPDLELAHACDFGLEGACFDMDVDVGHFDYWNNSATILPGTVSDTQNTGFENIFSCASTERSLQEPWSSSTWPSTQGGSLSGQIHFTPESGSVLDPALIGVDSLPPRRDTSRPSCAHLSLAIAMMHQPSPQQAARLGTLQTSTTVQATMIRIEANIDKVFHMLRCSCGSDAYVVVMLAMNTFKILDWFEAAASLESWRTRDSLDSSAVSPFSDVEEDEDESLLAAQKILSKLHRVQSLVGLLSERIQALVPTASQHDVDVPSRNMDVVERSLRDPTAIDTPLPRFAFFRNLELDLRTRTRNLAQNVIKRL